VGWGDSVCRNYLKNFSVIVDVLTGVTDSFDITEPYNLELVCFEIVDLRTVGDLIELFGLSGLFGLIGLFGTSGILFFVNSLSFFIVSKPCLTAESDYNVARDLSDIGDLIDLYDLIFTEDLI